MSYTTEFTPKFTGEFLRQCSVNRGCGKIALDCSPGYGLVGKESVYSSILKAYPQGSVFQPIDRPSHFNPTGDEGLA